VGRITSGLTQGTEVRSCEEFGKSLGRGPKECGEFLD
jgi:hypothetical protein